MKDNFIKKSINVKIYLILGFTVFSFLCYLVMIIGFKSMIADTPMLKYMITFSLIVFLLAIDIALFINILKLRTLVNVEPVKCIIEEFVYVAYYSDGHRKYNIFPLVRSLSDNKLYLTYSDYSLIRYNKIRIGTNRYDWNIKIYRRDGSYVNVGDIAYMYVKKFLNVNVDIDYNKHMISLNKDKILFSSDKFDINIFNNINYFEGVVDIELYPER